MVSYLRKKGKKILSKWLSDVISLLVPILKILVKERLYSIDEKEHIDTSTTILKARSDMLAKLLN